jgi:hypothetical protein
MPLRNRTKVCPLRGRPAFSLAAALLLALLAPGCASDAANLPAGAPREGAYLRFANASDETVSFFYDGMSVEGEKATGQATHFERRPPVTKEVKILIGEQEFTDLVRLEPGSAVTAILVDGSDRPQLVLVHGEQRLVPEQSRDHAMIRLIDAGAGDEAPLILISGKSEVRLDRGARSKEAVPGTYRVFLGQEELDAVAIDAGTSYTLLLLQSKSKPRTVLLSNAPGDLVPGGLDGTSETG